MSDQSTIPGAMVIPLGAGPGELRVEIHDAPVRPAEIDRAVDAAWARLHGANPRFFDGCILSVERVTACAAGGDTIVCVRDRFRYLAAQPEVATGVQLLGVNGVILGRDRRGGEHVLLGRRGYETRVYDGMWELAPGGGVDAPPEGVTHLALADIRRAMMKEVREELGLEVDASGAVPVAVTRDTLGASDIVSLRVELPREIDPRWTLCQSSGACDWEYIDAAWLSRADAAQFDRTHAHAIIPPTRAMLKWLGWT